MPRYQLVNSNEFSVKSVPVLSYSRKHCGTSRIQFESVVIDCLHDEIPDESEAIRLLYEFLTKKHDGFIYIPLPKYKAIVVYAENSELPEQIIRIIGYKSELRIFPESVCV